MDKKTNVQVNPLYGFAVVIMEAAIFGLLGEFWYGSGGFMAMAVLSIVCGLAVMLSLVPFVGVGLEAYVLWWWVLPMVLMRSGLDASWLTTLIVWLNLGIGLVITAVMSYVSVKLMRGV